MKISRLYQQIKCTIGIHKWTLIALDSTFYTTYVNRNNYKRYWSMCFYCCDCCSKRKFTDTLDSYETHHGIENSKIKWLERGLLTRDATIFNAEKKSDTAKILEFKCIDGGKNEV